MNSRKVVDVGPDLHGKDGKLLPVAIKEGDTVLLPDYGGTEVELDHKEYVSICSF
ncbi:10 kDa chaperonin-like [Trifolium medium]|uniref:10 kDa chaperonin-like n=1 Tax=Trifolium medium TaxID=97028 RepID=A0A392NP80_9FABA|nr:10 kDa chaperonin-like [Trifolium medium]